MGQSGKVVFKPYNQDQPMLLPPSLDELIIKEHPVRVLNKIIDKINTEKIEKKYKGGGTSSYSPRLLLKILVYSYLKNIYSSRKMEDMTKENIHMMWLSAMQQPDHNTINRFRGERLEEELKDIFSQIVMMLAEEGALSIEEIYVDGTKIEANANKYTFVWKKSIKYNKERVKQQINELWEYTVRLSKEEEKEKEEIRFAEIAPEKVEETIRKIDEALAGKEVDSKVKQKLNYARKNWPKNLKKYEEQEKKLAERNSCSKTDEDATFMRMKEDHMKNGQLKAGYNVQISSNNQYIVNYSLHQKPADTTTLPEHIEAYKAIYNRNPEVVIADAGYGSEENYTYLENNKIEAYVKYNTFNKEQNKKKEDRKPFTPEKLYYNKGKDCYYCPMGQQMNRIGETIRKSDNQYERQMVKYQAKNCDGCSLRGACHNQRDSRVIEVSHAGNYLKKKAKEKLESEQGILYRKKRGVDVEPVFANIKQNKNFRRFLLRGITKVGLEFGLLAIAHNLSKWIAAAA